MFSTYDPAHPPSKDEPHIHERCACRIEVLQLVIRQVPFGTGDVDRLESLFKTPPQNFVEIGVTLIRQMHSQDALRYSPKVS